MHRGRRQFLARLPAALLAAQAPPSDRFELSSGTMRLRIAAGSSAVWIESFAFQDTDDLVPSRPPAGILRSCTGILAEGGAWHFSRSTRPAELAASSGDGGSIHIPGILLGPDSAPLAREEWTLELAGGRLTWRIRRLFLRDCLLRCDRFPALVFRTTLSSGRFAEIPGFLDDSLVLDGTAGFPLHASDPDWYEAQSSRRQHEIAFAPSGTALRSTLATGVFTCSKVPADGTSPAIALGASLVDRKQGPVLHAAGSSQHQVWTLELDRSPGVAPFSLALPDTGLAELARDFAAVHNQWMGCFFGNNPASVPVLHEMAWFPMIQGIYGMHPGTRRALERQLTLFQRGVKPDGYVWPRWWLKGFYRVQWGNLHDQVPHFILAMYHHAINTGDREFLRRMMPALDRVVRYLLALDRDGDGVIEVPGCSGLPDGGKHCSNWYDIVEFGHKDAYINAYACAALDAMAEMKAWLGDPSAERYHAAHGRAVAGHNTVFWSEAHGFYLDWIDERERMPESGRAYFYTDPNLLAIIFGIAGRARAERVLANLDRHYDGLCRQFQVSRDAVYATPCNLIPVSQPGDLVDFGKLGNQKVFPNYENGCSFFHTTGLEIAARAVAGQSDRAYEIFERVMRQGYARNRFWAAALKWDTGELISEPLNNALLILWGFLRGAFGVWPSLRKLEAQGAPPARMEGARYRFCHLGKDVVLSVRAGRTVIEPA